MVRTQWEDVPHCYLVGLIMTARVNTYQISSIDAAMTRLFSPKRQHAMIKFVHYLLLVLVAGCDHPSGLSQSNGAVARMIPVITLKQVPKRVKFVQVGMTREEAIKTLGLADYRLLGLGGGPLHAYNVDYQLRTNCILTLGLDLTKDPSRITTVRGGFAPAVLTGDGWKAIATVTPIVMERNWSVFGPGGAYGLFQYLTGPRWFNKHTAVLLGPVDFEIPLPIFAIAALVGVLAVLLELYIIRKRGRRKQGSNQI
jgi:hypothetical protein